jgi:hydrogenase/urease accessory protein HupE
MIAEAVYALCAVTSAACAVLLWRAQSRTKVRMLFWCALGFAGLSLNNAALFVDKVMLPETDLSVVRLIPGILGLAVLCYGLIWDTDA